MPQTQPTRGKDIIYLVQAVDATVGESGFIPAAQTEGTYSREKEMLDEQTKQGRVVAPANSTESFELTMYEVLGDEGQSVIEDAYENDKQIKVWRVNVNLNANGQHDARFAYGHVESLESSDGDGFVEHSTTIQIIDKAKKGEMAPLPTELIEAAQYAFEEPGETGTAATTA